VDFDKLVKKEIAPPFVPDVQNPEDVGNIDQEFLDLEVESEEDKPKKNKDEFKDFTYQKAPIVQ